MMQIKKNNFFLKNLVITIVLILSVSAFSECDNLREKIEDNFRLGINKTDALSNNFNNNSVLMPLDFLYSTQEGETFLKKEAFITGSLIGGEALAMTLGMTFLSDNQSDWLNVKNGAFLTLDLACGAGLIYLAFSSDELRESKWLYILSAVSFATHLYRYFEYRYINTNEFSFNPAIDSMNSIKLSATFATSTTGLILRLDLGL
jgi:hypothetical protein